MTTANLNERASRDSAGTTGVFMYPIDLGSVDTNDYIHYVTFTIYQRTGKLSVVNELALTPSGNENSINISPAGTPSSSNLGILDGGGLPLIGGGVTKSTDTIVMYLPPNLQVEYGPQWANQEIGILGAMAQGIKNIDWSGLSMPSVDGLKNWVSSSGSAKAIALTAANAAEGLGLQGMKGMAEKGSGAILNPYSEVTFSGVNNRQFNFTFKMLPRSKKEAEVVKSIIKLFKYHSAPSVNGSAVLIYPSEFHITFWRIQKDKDGKQISMENEHLFKMDMCACTQVQVNYSPTGNMKTFADGMPVEIDLTLGFTEMTIVTKEKIEKGF